MKWSVVEDNKSSDYQSLMMMNFVLFLIGIMVFICILTIILNLKLI
jgi:hypothetical protein